VAVAYRGEAGPLNGVAPYALDPQNADRLWEVSVELLAGAGRAGATVR
jgi:hypothetical protein